MTTPCVICIQNSEVKAKPGIFPCLGCKQMFFTQHVASHRQELSNQLDVVISDRNELQETVDRQEGMINVSVQMNLIDEWVKKSVEQIYQVADNVRQQITSLAEEQKTIFKGQFTQLSQQLDSFRKDENFYEEDIKLLKNKCNNLKLLLGASNVNVIIKDISSSLAQAITLQRSEHPVVETRSFFEDLIKNQRPYKQIRIPHDGDIHILNDVVLIHSGDDFTIMNLTTNSLQSCTIPNSRSLSICSSTYAKGFLCADRFPESKIGFLKLLGPYLTKTDGFDSVIKSIKCMVCLDDCMMLVCVGKNYNNCVQEWSLKGFDNQRTRATGPLHIWRPPLICTANEAICNITLDDKHISLLITGMEGSSHSRIEFRSRNMNIIGHILLNNYKIGAWSVLCRLSNGYLCGDKKDYHSLWNFSVFDDKHIPHEQKILSNYGVKSIKMLKFVSQPSTLAIYREAKSTDNLLKDQTRLLLDLYRM